MTPVHPGHSFGQLDRLRASLAHTTAENRRLTSLNLPLRMDRIFLSRRRMARFSRAAVLVPIRELPGGEARIILTVRSEQLRAHSGQVSFPGGRMEADEYHPKDTALRESHEEIGLDPTAVEIVGYLDDYPTVSRFRVTPVVGVVEGGAEVHSESDEVGEVFELPLSMALSRSSYRKGRFGRLRVPYYEINYERWRIWGATAGMLWNLMEAYERHTLGR